MVCCCCQTCTTTPDDESTPLSSASLFRRGYAGWDRWSCCFCGVQKIIIIVNFNQSIYLSCCKKKLLLHLLTRIESSSHPHQQTAVVCIPWNTLPDADWTHTSHTNARNAWWLWKRTRGEVQRLGCAYRRWRGWCGWYLSSCKTEDWFLTEDCLVKLWALLVPVLRLLLLRTS